MDESRRTEGFDAHLASALASAAAAGDCPDAETVAAWLDGSLDSSTRDACQSHFATCARCQAVIAAAARAEDVLATDRSPDVRAATVPTPSTVLRFPRRRLVWAAPIALAATVMLAVWVARSAREEATRPTPVQTNVAKAERTDRDRELAADTREKGAAPPLAPAASKPEQPRTTAPPSTVAKRAAPARPQGAAPVPAEPPAPVLAEARPSEVPAAPTTPAQLKGAEEAREAASAPPGARVSREAGADAATRSEVARAPAAAPVASTETRVVTTSKALMSSLRAASPSGAVEWQVVAGRRLVRTARDGTAGPTFDTGDDLRALAVWSDTVAWAVGARGAVWRTIDGRTWARATPPTNATIVGIVLHGSDRATATAEDGQRFTTEDGGLTWARE